MMRMHWNEHPDRKAMLLEIHARPYESLTAPLLINRLAFLVDPAEFENEFSHLCSLLESHGVAIPPAESRHVSANLGGVGLRWERHTEFITYTFWRRSADAPTIEMHAYDPLPKDWLHGVKGKLISLQRLQITTSSTEQALTRARAELDEDSLVGSEIVEGRLTLFTDLRRRPDGSVHWLINVHESLSERQLGRYVSRVLDLETYRLMALLGLPGARRVGSLLKDAERRLNLLADQIQNAARSEESQLLDDLTRLATEVEAMYAANHTRFSASAAYFDLTNSRVQELREKRINGLQTIRGFLNRRLTPAMQTCAWAERRLNNLSTRISQTSQLLRTRVELEQAESQQELMKTMTQRQGLQLMMQSAVEGLSIAAIAYYGAGIVTYLAEVAITYGWPISPKVTAALSIPLIAFSVWSGLRRLRKRVHDTLGDGY